MNEIVSPDNIPIENLGLPRRIYNALRRSDILTVSELKELLQTNKLGTIHFIGQKSLTEITTLLNNLYSQSPQIVFNRNNLSQESEHNNIRNSSQGSPAIRDGSSSNPDRKYASTYGIVDENIRSISIYDIELRASVRGPLLRSGIRTVGDLLDATDGMLLNINRIGPRSLAEIQQALKVALDNPGRYTVCREPQQVKKPVDWAHMMQDFLDNEKETHVYILFSRFGLKPQKLEKIAVELGVTRERVRQIQNMAIAHFLKRIKPTSNLRFLEKIKEIMTSYGGNLSLNIFRKEVTKGKLLGGPLRLSTSKRLAKFDLFDALICWLILISNPKYTLQSVVLPVDVNSLLLTTEDSIIESEILRNISSKACRKILRKIYFTGGISIGEAAKILLTSERVSELALQSLDLKKLGDYWYSIKSYGAEARGTKIPLRMAGLKILAATPEIDLAIFYDGLRRYINRFYSSIAPLNIVTHALLVFGFIINNDQRISTKLPLAGVLSFSEKCLISAIHNNGGVASFLEIAEEFFLRKLSLPAVSITLKRSPIVERLDDGLYKLRGTEVSWQAIEAAKSRQKNFAQNGEVVHGLDGIVRMKLTINSYAYLTGVVGAYRIREISGNWSIVYNGESFGNAKIDDSFLWGLSKVFKSLTIQPGDRIELAFDTWNRTLSIQKVKNGNS